MATVSDTGSIAVVGMFDGVHAGHRHLLAHLRREAADYGLRPLVVTFANHPLEIIAPAKAPALLSSPDEKLLLLAREGVEVEMLTFDEALRNTSTEGFLRMLRDRWNVSRMLLGFNNRFGYDAPSDFAEYQQIGRKCDIEIERGTEFSSTASQTVSSSEIRRLILNHEIPGANALLGRRYSLVGKVAHGQAIGRTIGFPTANVVPASGRKLIPPGGVYAAEALTTDGSRYAAMVNIGARPTICPDGATPLSKPTSSASTATFTARNSPLTSSPTCATSANSPPSMLCRPSFPSTGPPPSASPKAKDAPASAYI